MHAHVYTHDRVKKGIDNQKPEEQEEEEETLTVEEMVKFLHCHVWMIEYDWAGLEGLDFMDLLHK